MLNYCIIVSLGLERLGYSGESISQPMWDNSFQGIPQTFLIADVVLLLAFPLSIGYFPDLTIRTFLLILGSLSFCT